MHVYCAKCGYDSGDFDTNEEIAAKVNGDGGHMMLARDENGTPTGWEITCPNPACKADDPDGGRMHLD